MSSACARVVSRCWRSCSIRRRREARARELVLERLRAREALALDRRHRREEAREPDVVEGGGILGRDREPAARREDARGLGERARPVDQVDDHPHHDGVEPARLERQRLGARDLRVDAVLLGARDHRLRRVDRPDAGELARLERGGEPAGAAPDLEHACGVQLAEPDELDEDLPPVVVDRAQLLVARGAEVEPGRRSAQLAGASCSWRSGRAPALTSVGSPRSRNGTSITSKSRGRIVDGNTSRASREQVGGRSSAARCGSARAARRLRRVRSRPPGGRSSGRSPAARSRSSSRNVASWTSTSAPAKSTRDGIRRSGVAGVHDGPTGARRPDELLGLHRSPVGERDRLAALQRASLGPERDAERVGRPSLSKRPGRSLSTSAYPSAGTRWSTGKRTDVVAVARQRRRRRAARRARRGYVSFPNTLAERVEEVAKPGRPVDGERHVAHPQRERLEHPGQAEVVVGVEMRDEDVLEVDEADRRAQQLALGSLAAVEEQPVAAAPNEQGRGSAPGGRRAGRGAEEDDVEVHAPMVTARSRTAATAAGAARPARSSCRSGDWPAGSARSRSGRPRRSARWRSSRACRRP